MTAPGPAAAPTEASTTTEATTAAAAKTLNALLHMPAQMELSQIELIYRAEGNANLVLALPQFKKVLRLPKMISSRGRGRGTPTPARQSQSEESQDNCQPAATAGGTARPEEQPNVSDPAKAPAPSPAGVLTMPDFMAYIEIMRRLLGNEFVCEADIVAIPKEGDRFWINEHIRAHRPVARLDKEFVGPFGLMLPDVTQLPATFDVLLANLQAKDMNTDMNVDICTGIATDSSSSSGSACKANTSGSTSYGFVCSSSSTEESKGIRRVGDTFAIEIKPKQGWLQLPSDVSDLFDLMPAAAAAREDDETIDPAQLTCDPLMSECKCRCRYCSMQQLKLQTGKIKRLSDYCPLELFSGSPRRMFAALDALFACPQNNLRVFQAGNLIYGDHANSISCDELHTRLFPGEIMALIKHLLVACLLREYQCEEQQEGRAEEPKLAKNVAAFGESASKRCGTETKAILKATTEIGAANAAAVADAAAAWQVEEEKDKELGQVKEPEPGIVECVKAVAGQPQRRSTSAAAVEKATQRYTKRCRMAAAATTTEAVAAETTTTAVAGQTTIAPTSVSTNVAMATAATTPTETETLATSSSSPSQAELSKAEIFHLPKNCVLQKILHLQLLVKHHFHYMWQAGHAQHATPSYDALRALLSRSPATWDNVDQLPPEEAYMLGATALDCSIMLTFQEIRCQSSRHNSSLQPWLVTLQGRQFLTKLSVLDLDPKPDSHFHKFIKQTQEIEKCCRALN